MDAKLEARLVRRCLRLGQLRLPARYCLAVALHAGHLAQDPCWPGEIVQLESSHQSQGCRRGREGGRGGRQSGVGTQLNWQGGRPRCRHTLSTLPRPALCSLAHTLLAYSPPWLELTQKDDCLVDELIQRDVGAVPPQAQHARKGGDQRRARAAGQTGWAVRTMVHCHV